MTSVSSLMYLAIQEMVLKHSFYNCLQVSGKGEDPWTQTPIDPPLPHQFKSVLHVAQLPLT